MILDIKNISFFYDQEQPIFENINFAVAPGEIVSIVGPSGAGKTTLLKCLAGMNPLSQGEILVEGEKLANPNDVLKPGHPEIALVNQLFKLERNFTVRENISIQLHHLPKKDREIFVEELISILELEDLSHEKTKNLSGGEQQRVSIACALAKEPRCLLLDEPFVHFDVHLTKKIGEYLRKLVELRGMGVILVTHNGEEALAWSNRLLILRNGKITSQYTPQKAYYKPKNLFEGRFFGELNSVYLKGRQILFRPTQFSLKPTKGRDEDKVMVEYTHSRFNGPHWANYFKLLNGKEIVLYSTIELSKTKEIYV